MADTELAHDDFRILLACVCVGCVVCVCVVDASVCTEEAALCVHAEAEENVGCSLFFFHFISLRQSLAEPGAAICCQTGCPESPSILSLHPTGLRLQVLVATPSFYMVPGELALLLAQQVLLPTGIFFSTALYCNL